MEKDKNEIIAEIKWTKLDIWNMLCEFNEFENLKIEKIIDLLLAPEINLTEKLTEKLLLEGWEIICKEVFRITESERL